MVVVETFVIVGDTYFSLKNLLFSLCRAAQHLWNSTQIFNFQVWIQIKLNCDFSIQIQFLGGTAE